MMRGTSRRARTAAVVGGVAMSMVMAASASAAQIVVSSAADPAGTATDCTLRQALESANTNTSPVRLRLRPGSRDRHDHLRPGDPARHDRRSAELAISSNVTIQGPGADELTVSGNTLSASFTSTSGTSTISGLKIEEGFVNIPSAGPPAARAWPSSLGATLTLDDAVGRGNDVGANLSGEAPGPTAVAIRRRDPQQRRHPHRAGHQRDRQQLIATAINGDVNVRSRPAPGCPARTGPWWSTGRPSPATPPKRMSGPASASARPRPVARSPCSATPSSGPDAIVTSSTIVDNSADQRVRGRRADRPGAASTPTTRCR